MQLWEIFMIAVALSMDAFAVSVCKGLSVEKAKWKHMMIAGAYFGGFQGLMPLIGYFLGTSFRSLIERVDHWIAFGLLALIGINMIRESFGPDEECTDCTECTGNSFGVKPMLPLAVATSIDALTVGITFAIQDVNILVAVISIAITTFVLSAIGVKLGKGFGERYKSKAEFAGGLVLILMGIKILLEHLGVLV